MPRMWAAAAFGRFVDFTSFSFTGEQGGTFASRREHNSRNAAGSERGRNSPVNNQHDVPRGDEVSLVDSLDFSTSDGEVNLSPYCSSFKDPAP